MIFTDTALPGVLLIEARSHLDERGSFTRTFCRETFAARGIDDRVAQTSVSCSLRAGTLRGLHYQRAPWEETKLVRCVRGRVHDVVVDVRPDSPAHGRWWSIELAGGDGRSVLVPPGVAHGFLTLDDDTEVQYQISVPHHPECAAGVRWDDPLLAIDWPRPPHVLSPRDRAWPPLVAPSLSGARP